MEIKYLTLNVWNGGKLFDEIVEFIKQEDPDIIAMQEIYGGSDPVMERQFRSYAEFKKLLGYEYATFSPAFLDSYSPHPAEQGNAVYSKYPILSTVTTFYDVPYKNIMEHKRENFPFFPRLLQHVLIEISKETDEVLNVFNTHGIWGEDGLDNERRLRMSETIVREVKDKQHAILSGDFNVNQGTQSIKNIESVMTNIFKDELQSTFNMKQKPADSGFGVAIVDNIFVSSDIIVKEHHMPTVDVSDHMPLVAILGI